MLSKKKSKKKLVHSLIDFLFTLINDCGLHEIFLLDSSGDREDMLFWFHGPIAHSSLAGSIGMPCFKWSEKVRGEKKDTCGANEKKRHARRRIDDSLHLTFSYTLFSLWNKDSVCKNINLTYISVKFLFLYILIP